MSMFVPNSKSIVETLLRLIILGLLISFLWVASPLFSDLLNIALVNFVPLYSALFLLLIPLMTFKNPATRSMLSGLFAMNRKRTYRQFCFSIVSIFFVADTILAVFYPLIYSIKIQSDKEKEYQSLRGFIEKIFGFFSSDLKEFIDPDSLMFKIIYVIAIIILVLPTISAIVKATLKDDKEKQNIILLLLTLITLGLVLFKNLYNNFILNIASQEIVDKYFKEIMCFLASKGCNNDDKYYGLAKYCLVNWLASFCLFLIIYIIIFILYWPNQKRGQKFFTIDSTPALMYIMLILTISIHLLSCIQFLSFLFAIPKNIPMLLIVPLGVYILCHWVFNINYFFDLKPDNDEPTKSDFEKHTFRDVLEKRAEKLKIYIKSKGGQCEKDQEKTLVVVCASGGGIQATGWTVKVLTGLQELLGPSFTLATGLISSVSGGSVGTMYYLDYLHHLNLNSKDSNQSCSCQNLKNFDKTSQDDIFERATSDSLGAVGWGLAYPDFFRFFGFPAFTPTINRGWAIESYWKQQMKKPDSSLSTWREEIEKGNLPIPVFNATIVEEGYRLLISPMNFIGEVEHNSEQQGKQNSRKCARDFNIVYKGYDLHVATAARLSATFPYVSPICRAYIPSTEKISNLQKYHIADGGYSDNSGVLTAVDCLSDLLEEDQRKKEGDQIIKRVLVIMINPFPIPNTDSSHSNCKTANQSKNFYKIDSLLTSALIKSFSGVINAFISPFVAFFKVRDSISNSRNDKELYLLKNAYKDKVEIEILPIDYSSEIDENTPLSWKLTERQKERLDKALNHYLENNSNKIKEIWEGKWGMPINKKSNYYKCSNANSSNPSGDKA